MTERWPAESLAAVPGRRSQTIELAAEVEQRGFSGLYCPSFGDAMGLCLSIAHANNTIGFGTSVQPIYLQHRAALATSAGNSTRSLTSDSDSVSASPTAQ